MFSRVTNPLSHLPSAIGFQQTRAYLTKPALTLLTREPKYAALIKEAKFQPPEQCIPHQAQFFERVRRTLDPHATSKTFSFGEDQDDMQKQGLPSALLNTKSIDATSAENIYQAIKEHGYGVLMHYGIGTGYADLHALTICDVFEMQGQRYAILLDTNDRENNPATERARQLLPPSGSLDSLSDEQLASINAHEGFFRVVNLDGLVRAGQQAFESSTEKAPTTWSSWFKNLISTPMQPTLFVPDKALLSDKEEAFRTREGTLTQFAAAMLTNRTQIEYDEN
jgi:hypothetical protein